MPHAILLRGSADSHRPSTSPSRDQAEVCGLATPLEATQPQHQHQIPVAGADNKSQVSGSAARSSSIGQPHPRDTTPLSSPSPNTTPSTTFNYISPSSPPSSPLPPLPPPSLSLSHQACPHLLSSLTHQSTEGSKAMPISPTTNGKMIFRSNTAQRRRNMATTNSLTSYEADLTSRDRQKQKEAVKKFLSENIEDDWDWQWPQGSTTKLPKNVEEAHWKERDEWLSNTNDSDDDPAMPTSSSPDTVSFTNSPFQFESPDDVGDTIKRREYERKRRRERKLKDEMSYNEGMRCFTARRDAWTGARRVNRPNTRTSSNVVSIGSVAHPDASSDEGTTSDTLTRVETDLFEEIEIPVAPPLLPPANAMRASITPSAYTTIYEKVVVQGLQPSCPMNLRDVVNSCVKGWQQDGTWTPKGTAPEPPVAKRKARKLSVASIFGLQKHEKELKDKEKDEEREKESQSGIRRSLQRLLSIGHKDQPTSPKEHAHTNGNGNTNGDVFAERAKETEHTTAA